MSNKGKLTTSSKTVAATYNAYTAITTATAKAGHSYLVFATVRHTNSASGAMNLKLVGVDTEEQTYNASMPRGCVINHVGVITAKDSDTTIGLHSYGYMNTTYNFVGWLCLVQLD